MTPTRMFWLSYIDGRFRMIKGSQVKAIRTPADVNSETVEWRLQPLTRNQLLALVGRPAAAKLWKEAEKRE